MIQETRLNVPLFRQHRKSNDCVPKSIESLVTFFGIDISYPQIKKNLKTNLRGHGTQLSDLRTFANKVGLKFTRIKLKSRSIKMALAACHPVAICYEVREDKNYSHFSLITGIYTDLTGTEHVRLTDPLYGKVTLPLSILRRVVSADCSWIRSVRSTRCRPR